MIIPDILKSIKVGDIITHGKNGHQYLIIGINQLHFDVAFFLNPSPTLNRQSAEYKQNLRSAYAQKIVHSPVNPHGYGQSTWSFLNVMRYANLHNIDRAVLENEYIL